MDAQLDDDDDDDLYDDFDDENDRLPFSLFDNFKLRRWINTQTHKPNIVAWAMQPIINEPYKINGEKQIPLKPR